MTNKKANTGINLLISLVVILFIAGIFLFVATITNSEMAEALYDTTTDSLNETLTTVDNSTGEAVTTDSLRDCANLVLTVVHNDSEAGTVIGAGNYTISGCSVIAVAGGEYDTGEDWHIIGTAEYEADNSASIATNDTSDALSDVVDWFPIFIVVGAVAVILTLVGLVIAYMGKGGFMNQGGA